MKTEDILILLGLAGLGLAAYVWHQKTKSAAATTTTASTGSNSSSYNPLGTPNYDLGTGINGSW